MTIPDIIKITERKLAKLRNDSLNASLAGDLEEVDRVDSEIIETEVTLDQLKSI